jgi:hypothetical protein
MLDITFILIPISTPIAHTIHSGKPKSEPFPNGARIPYVEQGPKTPLQKDQVPSEPPNIRTNPIKKVLASKYSILPCGDKREGGGIGESDGRGGRGQRLQSDLTNQSHLPEPETLNPDPKQGSYGTTLKYIGVPFSGAERRSWLAQVHALRLIVFSVTVTHETVAGACIHLTCMDALDCLVRDTCMDTLDGGVYITRLLR